MVFIQKDIRLKDSMLMAESVAQIGCVQSVTQ